MIKIIANDRFSQNLFDIGLTKYYKIFGYEYSDIKSRFDDLASVNSIRIYLDNNCLDTLVTVEFSREICQTMVVDIIQADIYNRFGTSIYAEDSVTLQSVAVDMLRIRKRTVTVAESLTGGMIASHIVDVSNASSVLKESFVTYSNEAKNKYLGVPQDYLDELGAVSQEVSLAMCQGLFDHTDADYAISTTGIAGPTGATLTKPLGLCYISVGNRQQIITKKYIFDGDRHEVRSKATNTALFMLIKFAKSN